MSEWSESEVIFWSSIFFVFRYIEGGVLGNNNICIKKCTTNFLWVLNFGQVWELPQQFSKSHYYGDFLKNGLKSNFLEKFYKRFPCKKWRKFFIGDFHGKLKVKFKFFTRDFPGKKIEWKKFLKGFLLKIEAEGKILKGFPL